MLKLTKKYVCEKYNFRKFRIQYTLSFRIFLLFKQFSVHSRIISIHTLGNTDLDKYCEIQKSLRL